MQDDITDQIYNAAQGLIEEMQKEVEELREYKQRVQSEIIPLLIGIDKEESLDDDGWWETSTGAEFGADILHRIKTIIGDEVDA